jgi:SRSO17 transposase
VRTTNSYTTAADGSVDPSRWAQVLDESLGRIAGVFVRSEPRRTARAFVTGLLSTVERKTCWSLAEAAGDRCPAAMQRLLRTACWDEGRVTGLVRGWLADRLGDPGGVLIADETGFVKKGTHSVGVQRQYSGTAGRVENCQIGVFLAYTGARGRALVDRRLYLPEDSWCNDPDRRAAAGVPPEIRFATKPTLALEMIHDAVDAGLPVGWIAADEVYGADPGLRAGLEERGLGYVLAVGCNRRVAINDGRTRVRVDALPAMIPPGHWQRYSAGVGAKGPRDYDWAWIRISTHPADADPHRWLLIRRNPTTAELAFYLCWSPAPTSLATLVQVAGARWAVEECFQAAKTHVGLDHYQVRGWTGWHRFTALAILALGILAVCASGNPPPPTNDPTGYARTSQPIALTLAEIRRLINHLIPTPIHDLAHHLHWSTWRRHHQARARQAHYQRRLALNR